MKRVILIALILPTIVLCQPANKTSHSSKQTGINFNENLSWKQILAKAKSENKLIFLDCYTSWCGWCKVMDKEVYPKKEVGDYFNDRFISLRVKMDKTKEDNKFIKSWYHDAFSLRDQYHVNEYPTFFFFSPDGTLLMRSVGYKKIADFIHMAAMATDPKNSYRSLMLSFRNGLRDTGQIKQLAIADQLAGDTTQVKELLAEYIKLIPLREVLSSHNLSFIRDFSNYQVIKNTAIKFKTEYVSKGFLTQQQEFLFFLSFPYTLTSSDRFFKFIQQNKDSVMIWGAPKGYINNTIMSVIMREEIKDKIWKDGVQVENPDWDGIRKTIIYKYGDAFVERAVYPYQLSYYRRTKDWTKYLALVNERIKKNPPVQNGKEFGPVFGDARELDLKANEILAECNDLIILKEILAWCDTAISIEIKEIQKAIYIDTKARILYKLGRKKDAIDLEQQAADIESKVSNVADSQIKVHLQKMKAGSMVW